MQEIQRNRLLKTLFGCKVCSKWPLDGLQSMPEGWKMDHYIGFSICDHFAWALGYFPRQTKLKWTKNFKALFLSLTKSNRKGFWQFGTDMYLNKFWPKITHICSRTFPKVSIFPAISHYVRSLPENVQTTGLNYMLIPIKQTDIATWRKSENIFVIRIVPQVEQSS